MDDDFADVRFDVEARRAAAGVGDRDHQVPQPRRPALPRRSARRPATRTDRSAGRHDPARPHPARTQPDRAVQRVQAAVPGTAARRTSTSSPASSSRCFQGEGGTITSLLAHTASLTSAIAGKDKVIGQVIANLNTVLDTVNERTAELGRTHRPAAAAGHRARRAARADRRRDRRARRPDRVPPPACSPTLRPPLKDDIAAARRAGRQPRRPRRHGRQLPRRPAEQDPDDQPGRPATAAGSTTTCAGCPAGSACPTSASPCDHPGLPIGRHTAWRRGVGRETAEGSATRPRSAR